jgi:carboxyl-terminal processing protease
MNRLFRLGALAVAIAVSAGGLLARADDAPHKANTYAVVVGVGTFADGEIKPRPTADEDARTIAGILTDQAVGGIPAEHVSVLLSKADEKFGAKEGTKANILTAIGDAVKKVGKDDTLLIYMVMQGATAGDKPCLFAEDTTFKERLKTGISGGDIEDKFKGLKSEQVLVFLDLNLKGHNSKEAMVAPNIGDFVRVFLGLAEKDVDAEPPPGRVVFRNGNGIQPMLEVGKNGLFTSVVAEALRGKADNDGYEADGHVFLDELIKYVDKHLPEKAAFTGKTAEEKLQALRINGFAPYFAVTRNPGAAAKAEERLNKFEKLSTESKLDKETAEEGKKLLTRMPRLKALQDLRKSYQKFADGDLNSEQLAAARERTKSAMTLSAQDAESFAEKEFAALDVIRRRYIKKLNIGEMAAAGIKGLYKGAEVKMPENIADKLAKAKDFSDKEVKELLKEARAPLGKREDFAEDKDIGIMTRMAVRKFVDDYTTYIDKEKVPELDKGLDNRFRGIGVVIRRDIARDALLVVSPIRNSPAYKAGILAGDLILEIIREADEKGKPFDKPEVTSTKGMETQDAVKLIMGLPATKLKLKIEREGEKEPIFKELARDTVSVESAMGWKRNPKDDSWDYYVDPKNKIAYIYLNQFSRYSDEEIGAILKKLSKDGVKGLVMDVRDNPGGYLDVVIRICDMFIDDGVIVSIRPGNSRANETTERGHSEGSYLNFPMVCLVNDQSASASEILSACLQDHGRAVVMGERSFGKGSVQNVEKFPATGGKIKMTIATFWPPSGRNLNKASTTGKDEEDWGVRPDKGYELKLERAERDELSERLYNWSVIPRRDVPAKETTKKEFKDRQLDMALEYLRSQIKVSRGDKEKEDK